MQTVNYDCYTYDISKYCLRGWGGGRGSRSIVIAYWAAGQQVSRLSDWSGTWGMIYTKIHLISPGCPWPSIALQSRMVALNTNHFTNLRFQYDDLTTTTIFIISIVLDILILFSYLDSIIVTIVYCSKDTLWNMFILDIVIINLSFGWRVWYRKSLEFFLFSK